MSEKAPRSLVSGRNCARSARARRPRARRRRMGARPAARHRLRKTSTWRSSAFPAAELPALLEPFGRVEPIGQSFPVYKIGDDRRRASAPRIEERGRGHKGFVVEGDPSMSHRRGRAAPRLHGQRDLLGSADRRISSTLRRPRRSRAQILQGRRSGRRSATTACACCARCSSRRASR